MPAILPGVNLTLIHPNKLGDTLIADHQERILSIQLWIWLSRGPAATDHAYELVPAAASPFSRAP